VPIDPAFCDERTTAFLCQLSPNELAVVNAYGQGLPA
jgi:hypothetical protein